MTTIVGNVWVGYELDPMNPYHGLTHVYRAAALDSLDAQVNAVWSGVLEDWAGVELGDLDSGHLDNADADGVIDALLKDFNDGSSTDYRRKSGTGRDIFSIHHGFRDGMRRWQLQRNQGQGWTDWNVGTLADGVVVTVHPFVAASWEQDW